MVYEDSLGISKFYNDKTDKQDFKPSDDRLILLFNALRQENPEALNLKTGVIVGSCLSLERLLLLNVILLFW